MRRFAVLVMLWCGAVWASPVPPTPLQQAQYLSLPASRDITGYLTRLDEMSGLARLVPLGESAGGRPIVALLVSSSPAFLQDFQPEPGKATVLVLASQHGNEPAGAEAVQQLARELVNGSHDSLLQRLNLVLVAMANPDGRDLSRRHNASNDNTNIDYVALNAGETRLLVDALQRFDPDLVYDAHESGIWKRVLTREQGWLTDVELQFETGNNPNIDSRLRDYTEQHLLPALVQRVSAAGVRAEPYRGEITQLGQSVSRGGLGITNLRNYAAMQGRVSVLVEGRLDNKSGHYPTPRNIAGRMHKQHLALLTTLELAGEQAPQWLALARQARSGGRGRGEAQTLWMQVGFAPNARQPEVRLPLVRQRDGQRRYHGFANHDAIAVAGAVALPPAYAVTRERERMARWLTRHHIRFATLRAPQRLPAERLHITAVQPVTASRSGVREKWQVSASTEPATVTLGPGDLLVPMSQPLGPLAALMLDPRSVNALYQEQEWNWLAPGEFPVFPVMTAAAGTPAGE